MKNFDAVGKNIKNVTENAKKPTPKMCLPNVMRRWIWLCSPTLFPASFGILKAKIPWERGWSFPESPTKSP